MKRIGNLYKKIISIENLQLADEKAQKGKKNRYGVKLHNKNKENNIFILHEMLKNKTYKTSGYDIFKVFEPKERDVYRLPYFPDRITHHAVMNILESIFVSTFTADSYSCIKGKGIHAAANSIKTAIQNMSEETVYCLKMDVKKFYPNIDHDCLKFLLRKKIKDQDLLWLLDEIIDSADGLPIGNYLSQYFANFYLTYFDHWIKEQKAVKYYFRYADDLVILSDNKPYLHELLAEIKGYLTENLKLTVKKNYQIFPVSSRGIDFVGYRFYHTHTLLRKRIKQNFARMLKKSPNRASIASYNGWAKHCDSKNLLKKYYPMNNFKDFGIKPKINTFLGDKIKIDRLLNIPITIHRYKLEESKKKPGTKLLTLQIEKDGYMHVIFTGSTVLTDMISQVPKEKFPFITKIVKESERLEFT